MHLEGPWLSTTGKKKGKQKFASAEHARKARELDESWKDLLRRQGIEQAESKSKRAMSSEVWKPLPVTHRGSDVAKIPSLPFTGGSCAMPEPKVYTGSEMIGIGQLHKSNAIPIFKKSDAEDLAKMRR